MPIGTLKYKQDDGSVIELNPLGVDTEARTSATAAQTAADKANTNIGNWNTDHPGQTISECATSIENEVTAADAKADANAAVIGNWADSFPGKTIAETDTEQNKELSTLRRVAASLTNQLRVLIHDESPVTFEWVQLTRGDAATNRYFNSPVPLTKTDETGCYTIRDVSGTANVYYIDDTDDEIKHTKITIDSIQVLNKYTARINFASEVPGKVVGYTMDNVSPSIALLKV